MLRLHDEIVLKAVSMSKIERSRSERSYEKNEGVWIDIYNDQGKYNFEGIGDRECSVEAFEGGYTIHE